MRFWLCRPVVVTSSTFVFFFFRKKFRYNFHEIFRKIVRQFFFRFFFFKSVCTLVRILIAFPHFAPWKVFGDPWRPARRPAHLSLLLWRFHLRMFSDVVGDPWRPARRPALLSNPYGVCNKRCVLTLT